MDDINTLQELKDYYNRKGSSVGFHYSEIIDSGDIGESIPVHDLFFGGITCTIIAGAGTGKFQFTTSSLEDILSGEAVWQDWAKGASTGTVVDVLQGPITALRGVSSSGEITIEVVS